jgi:hypothetical protein
VIAPAYVLIKQFLMLGIGNKIAKKIVVFKLLLVEYFSQVMVACLRTIPYQCFLGIGKVVFVVG